MTIPADINILATPAAEGRDDRHYVDWPAIFAGIVLALAISIVLLTFGSAIGLSFANFQAGSDVSPIWVAIVAASWLLWVEISSFMAGGYLTGRLRRRIGDGSAHEVDVRDGAHGLLVWAGSLVIGAVLAASGVGAIASAVGSAASTVTQAASNVAGGAAQGAAQGVLDPNAYFVDTLFRAPATGGTAAPAAAATTAPAAGTDTTAAATPAPATTAATTTAMTTGTNTGNSDAAKAEAGRILATGALGGGVSDTDKAYLAQLVAQNTGMPQADAQARVDQVMTSISDAKAKAAAAAESARKTGILAAFLIAASFLVAAVGAYWAASMGGRHRDEGTVFADVFRRY